VVVVESVPNISSSSQEVINQLKKFNRFLKNIHVDKFYNRSVFTFMGDKNIFEEVFQFVKKTLELIDMQFHKGVHPRVGAVDVVPFIALQGINEEELIDEVNTFSERVNKELSVPVYLYSKSARRPQRKLLKNIRKSEYEGLKEKLINEDFVPDFGEPIFLPESGIIVTGVRDVLVAYNVGLNTTDLSLAKRIATRIRESGNNKEEGMFKELQALGVAVGNNVEVTMNVLDIKLDIYKVFEAISLLAKEEGVEALYSEFVGLVPESVLSKGNISLLKLRNFAKNNILYGF